MPKSPTNIDASNADDAPYQRNRTKTTPQNRHVLRRHSQGGGALLLLSSIVRMNVKGEPLTWLYIHAREKHYNQEKQEKNVDCHSSLLSDSCCLYTVSNARNLRWRGPTAPSSTLSQIIFNTQTGKEEARYHSSREAHRTRLGKSTSPTFVPPHYLQDYKRSKVGGWGVWEKLGD